MRIILLERLQRHTRIVCSELLDGWKAAVVMCKTIIINQHWCYRINQDGAHLEGYGARDHQQEAQHERTVPPRPLFHFNHWSHESRMDRSRSRHHLIASQNTILSSYTNFGPRVILMLATSYRQFLFTSAKDAMFLPLRVFVACLSVCVSVCLSAGKLKRLPKFWDAWCMLATSTPCVRKKSVPLLFLR